MEALTTLRMEINRLGFTPDEQVRLRRYFTKNVERIYVVVSFLSDYKTDDEKRGYLKSLISTPALTTLRTEINRPGFTPDERVRLRIYFTKNVEQIDVAVSFLSDYKTDDGKRGYLKSLISTPESPPGYNTCTWIISSNGGSKVLVKKIYPEVLELQKGDRINLFERENHYKLMKNSPG
ncbi:7513_t:CDS:2 [Rhizophagus irregularis]|nr:7513_t:CDS:2 [Rhizophagus irregularis]